MCSTSLVGATGDALRNPASALGIGKPDGVDIPAPTVLEDTSTEDLTTAASAAKKAKTQRLQAKGRSSTILTGSQGVLTPPTTQKNTLLGQ